MEEVQAMPVIITNNPYANAKKEGRVIIKEQESDKFTKSNPGGIALASGVAVVAGTKTYKGAKPRFENVINNVENEFKEFMNAKQKPFTGLPNKLKVNLKYAGALALALGVAFLTFKDSDKDGKLDILECFNKFTNPQD